ncbi:MAG: glycosyltransferase, partial [Lysobacter spongiicola]|nr:glycosyltransferase [Lysobacter spongiicola]
MRYAIVTETYPPEVNGVALTVHALEAGLRARGHEVDLVRPRQQASDRAAPHEWLTTGTGLPRYPGLRLGWARPGALGAHWQRARPDAIYIATEGPLGWAALRAALRMGIPVATGFHTRFDRYMHDYGAPLLAPVALAWMRRFHNRGQATLVPTVELLHQLDQAGFRKVRRL